jgi:hypothetical protein
LGLISRFVLRVGANKDFEGRGFLLVVVLLYFDISFEMGSLWLRLPKGE